MDTSKFVTKHKDEVMFDRLLIASYAVLAILGTVALVPL